MASFLKSNQVPQMTQRLLLGSSWSVIVSSEKGEIIVAVRDMNLKIPNKNPGFPFSVHQGIKEPQILGHSLTLLLFMTSWASQTSHCCVVMVSAWATKHVPMGASVRESQSLDTCALHLETSHAGDQTTSLCFWKLFAMISRCGSSKSSCLPRLGSHSMKFQKVPSSHIPGPCLQPSLASLPRFSSRYHIWQNTVRQLLLSGVDFSRAHCFHLPKSGHPDLSLCFFSLLGFPIPIPTDQLADLRATWKSLLFVFLKCSFPR